MKSSRSEDNRLVLFDNPWLEKLTVVSLKWFLATWAMIVPLVVWAGGAEFAMPAAIGLVVTGWFIWSLLEYCAHRTLFHWDPEWLWLKRFVFVIHGNHHAQPRDELRNLMPPIVSIPVTGLVWALLSAAAGSAGTWIFVGFLIGYIAYDLTHYACHHWPMCGPVGMLVKRHHMQHHYITDDRNFGVSAIFWDYVFGTRLANPGQSKRFRNSGRDALHPAE
ncbi:MAG: fatty acid hydroxylase [Alphaproteobacteria bacterium HGW-Alphaproteobacteria-14]|nr:MAG: fatty acid hydroxylase [Alphaproteobacteria bacterium HGW-Alphaproteobacteria-14]